MPFSRRCRRFASRLRKLVIAAAIGPVFAGCVHGQRIPMPEQCSPLPDKMICANPPSIKFPEAGGFVCYRPEEIEPFLERCGAR